MATCKTSSTAEQQVVARGFLTHQDDECKVLPYERDDESTSWSPNSTYFVTLTAGRSSKSTNYMFINEAKTGKVYRIEMPPGNYVKGICFDSQEQQLAIFVDKDINFRDKAERFFAVLRLNAATDSWDRVVTVPFEPRYVCIRWRTMQWLAPNAFGVVPWVGMQDRMIVVTFTPDGASSVHETAYANSKFKDENYFFEMSPDKKQIMISGKYVYDRVSGALLMEIAGAQAGISSMSQWSPDSSCVVLPFDHYIGVNRPGQPTALLQVLRETEKPFNYNFGMAWSPNGHYLAVTHINGSTIIVPMTEQSACQYVVTLPHSSGKIIWQSSTCFILAQGKKFVQVWLNDEATCWSKKTIGDTCWCKCGSNVSPCQASPDARNVMYLHTHESKCPLDKTAARVLNFSLPPPMPAPTRASSSSSPSSPPKRTAGISSSFASRVTAVVGGTE